MPSSHGSVTGKDHHLQPHGGFFPKLMLGCEAIDGDVKL